MNSAVDQVPGWSISSQGVPGYLLVLLSVVAVIVSARTLYSTIRTRRRQPRNLPEFVEAITAILIIGGGIVLSWWLLIAINAVTLILAITTLKVGATPPYWAHELETRRE